jgi:hypothetical protein
MRRLTRRLAKQQKANYYRVIAVVRGFCALTCQRFSLQLTLARIKNIETVFKNYGTNSITAYSLQRWEKSVALYEQLATDNYQGNNKTSALSS